MYNLIAWDIDILTTSLTTDLIFWLEGRSEVFGAFMKFVV
jgi:hypothetical protein